MSEHRKRGRPPVEADDKKAVTMTFRATQAERDQLAADAAAAGHSISTEIAIRMSARARPAPKVTTRQNLTLRIRADLRDHLTELAHAHGRSLSEEVEHTLERALREADLAALVTEAVKTGYAEAAADMGVRVRLREFLNDQKALIERLPPTL